MNQGEPEHNAAVSTACEKTPVARYGPFVMNTQEKVRQAIVDYQHGRMGVISE